MDTVQTISPVAAVLALADVLGLDLPESELISIHPQAINSRYTASVDLQFHGAAGLGAMRAWAAYFGVTVEMPEPGRSFAYVHFTHSGVRFECYADIRPDKP